MWGGKGGRGSVRNTKWVSSWVNRLLSFPFTIHIDCIHFNLVDIYTHTHIAYACVYGCTCVRVYVCVCAFMCQYVKMEFPYDLCTLQSVEVSIWSGCTFSFWQSGKKATNRILFWFIYLFTNQYCTETCCIRFVVRSLKSMPTFASTKKEKNVFNLKHIYIIKECRKKKWIIANLKK